MTFYEYITFPVKEYCAKFKGAEPQVRFSLNGRS